MHRLKVTFLNPAGRLGGAEIALLDVLASLRNAHPSWELSLIVAASGPVRERAASLGVNTKILEFPRALARLGDSAVAGRGAGSRMGTLALTRAVAAAAVTLPSYVKKLRLALRVLDPDIIHTNGFKMHVLAALAAPRSTPLVWHVHDFVRSRPLMGRLLRMFRTRCSAVITNSLSVAEDVQLLLGEGLFVKPILNGIDLNRFKPEGESLDLDVLAGLQPCGEQIVRIGLLGTMARWKGHEIFLRAISLVRATRPVRAYIIGDALYETLGSQYTLDELREAARELGLAEVVGFTGFIESPEKAIRALDVVVHASVEPEPFGLVIVEGMACGRPVVASDSGGAAEVRRLSKGVLGFPPGDVTRLAEILVRLIDDDALRQRLGVEARASAETLFDRDRLAAQIEPVYRRVSNR